MITVKLYTDNDNYTELQGDFSKMEVSNGSSNVIYKISQKSKTNNTELTNNGVKPSVWEVAKKANLHGRTIHSLRQWADSVFNKPLQEISVDELNNASSDDLDQFGVRQKGIVKLNSILKPYGVKIQ
jgi:hypothetical protein